MPAVGDPQGYYRLLGVPRTASAEEIRKAFRKLAKGLHPDSGGKRAGGADFQALHDAYEVLRDPKRRLDYDAAGLAAEWQNAETTAEPGFTIARRSAFWRQPLSAGTIAVAGLVLLTAVVAVGATALVVREQARHEATTQELNRARAYNADLRARALSAFIVPGGLTAPGDEASARVRALFRAAIPFDEDGDLAADTVEALDEAGVALHTMIAEIPQGRAWTVIVAGYSPRAVGADGVMVGAWEPALFQIVTVMDTLVQYGVPPERLALSFAAGLLPAEEADTDRDTLEVSLLCCFD